MKHLPSITNCVLICARHMPLSGLNRINAITKDAQSPLLQISTYALIRKFIMVSQIVSIINSTPMMLLFAEKRYTCVHPSCLTDLVNAPAYFPTWTTFQHHLRTMHPPTCSHPSCDGRTFSSQKCLRAHLKLHEEREVEAELDAAAAGSDREDDNDEDRPRKKRRGGEMGRDWKCDAKGCEKDFKSVDTCPHSMLFGMGRLTNNIEKSLDDTYQCHPSRTAKPCLSSRNL